jgi:hypothetical protein
MAYLETLLALPIVLMVIAGLADFSFVFKDFLVAGNAASEALRTATLSRAEFCVPGTVAGIARTRAEDLLADGGVEPPRSQISNMVVQHTDFPARDLCDAGVVGVSFDVDSELWFLNHWFFPAFPLPPIDFTATATGVNENGN